MFRCRLLVGISIVALLLMSANTRAAYVLSTDQAGGIVPIVNYNFELPNDGKHNAWDIESNRKGNFTTDVPGWSSNISAQDSGVESGGPSGSVWSGFLMGGYSEWDDPTTWVEPSTWNITGYKIKAGDQFMLAVDAKDNWTANWFSPPLVPTLKMSLFYIDVGGGRVELASNTVDLTGVWSWATYKLDVINADAGAGRLLGIELQNICLKDSWIGVDNVRLIPEPATMALLGLGGLNLLRIRKRR